MDLKNVLGEIKTYNRNRHLEGPWNVASQLRPTLRYSMPVAAVVHTITSLACRPSVCERSPSPMTRFQREISASTRARQPYPDARCQPMRPRGSHISLNRFSGGGEGALRYSAHGQPRRALSQTFPDQCASCVRRPRDLTFGCGLGFQTTEFPSKIEAMRVPQ